MVTLVAAGGAELNEGRRPVCEDLVDLQACPLLYLPICGTDGNTYASECQLCVEKIKWQTKGRVKAVIEYYHRPQGLCRDQPGAESLTLKPKRSVSGKVRDYKIKQQRRARRAKRGRGQQRVVKAVLESEPAVDPPPDPQEKAEPVPSEPALPEPVYQQQPPTLTVQNKVGGIQPVAKEGELTDRSLDPAGEEDVLKPAEEDILEELNTPLENDHQDNEFNTHVLY
ncbi:hypothetical protein DUI87_00748 [Hirundo rustica rustica]|uniref:Kazal-like domain-containing protein n=1 Tax=Hirundo rustica rustica TaxID=333673 RepID=A0A3M0LEK8_HIRRU|nr:hypothetical protein DUI87_00748 [Hirundo rustica rustica]